MQTKKYTSYAQIEKDLEILKLEKEIYYQKMSYSVHETKEIFTPVSLVAGIISSSNALFTGTYGTIFKIVTPFFMTKVVPLVKKWISKKRGD